MGNFTCLFVFVLVLISGSYGRPQRDSAILDSGKRGSSSLDSDGCQEAMDIAILADISRSMNSDERDQLITIINNELVDKLGVSADGNHFSLITFGDDATLHNDFTDTSHYSAETFKRSVERQLKVVPDREGTRTDLAENLAVTKVFTPEGGDRHDAKNAMLIITDGDQWRDERWDQRPEIPFSNLTKALEEKGVYIKVVGVGIKDEARSEEKIDEIEKKMEEMAGGEENVRHYDDFNQLSDLYNHFKKSFCAECLMDVAFILDSSRSIPWRNFYEAKEVVKELLTNLDLAPNKSRVAVVGFGTSPSLEARFGQFDTYDRAKDAVHKLPKKGGRTRIDEALGLTHREVLPIYRNESYKMTIIFSDGKQSSGARGLKQTSKPLRDAGVHVIAVGIGPGKDERRLRLMTDRDEDVVDLKNITEHIRKIQIELKKHNCVLPKTNKQPFGIVPKCIDEPGYTRHCEKYANEVYCWDNPDFCALHCAKSCKLCS